MRFKLRHWPGLRSSESSIGAGRFTSKIEHSWLLEEDFRCLTWELLHRTVECPYNMAVASHPLPSPHHPPSEWPKREEDRNCHVFYDLIWGVTLCHFCSILLITQMGPIQCRRRLHKGMIPGGPAITGGHLGGWPPYLWEVWLSLSIIKVSSFFLVWWDFFSLRSPLDAQDNIASLRHQKKHPSYNLCLKEILVELANNSLNKLVKWWN